MPCTFVNFTCPSRTTRTHNKHQWNPTSHFHLFSLEHFHDLNMFSLPKNLKNELQSLIKLFIPIIVCFRNKIEDQVPNVKVKQGERFVEEEAKSNLYPILKLKQEQGKGFRKMGTNL